MDRRRIRSGRFLTALGRDRLRRSGREATVRSFKMAGFRFLAGPLTGNAILAF
jgi:hypothetical protein